MKKAISLGLLCATVAMPIRSDGWVAVAAGGYRGVAYAGPCWHAGWGCGGVSTGTVVAAGAAGVVAGAAITAATRPAVIVAPAPVVVTPAPVVVTPSPAFGQPPPAIGAIYYSLPNGAQATVINGQQYYMYGSFCYKPYFGNNGVYYEVVPYPN